MSHRTFKACIDACIACASECELSVTACSHEQDAANLPECILLNRYCADICRMAVAFVARSDKHTVHFAGKFSILTADIFNACADECGKHEHMEHCVKYAEACRKCARECVRMSKMQFVDNETVHLQLFLNE